MKYIVRTFILIIGFIFCINLNASTIYGKVPNFSNDYLKRYNDYSRYLVTTDSPYGFLNNASTFDNDYRTGGLLNREEFIISKDINGNTYLFNGLSYWTMTKSNNNIIIVDPSDTSYLSEDVIDAKYGIRVTDYVQNGVYLRGSGTSFDPWIFMDKFLVRFVFDDSKIGITPQSLFVPEDGTAVATVTDTAIYTYNDNDCGAVYNNGTLTLSNVKRDTICNVSTALAYHKITYNPSGYCSPNEKRVKHGKEIGTMCTPSKTGYTFKGWYDEETGGTHITTSTKLLEDLDLYARFEANTYTLTYDNNGGNGCTTLQRKYDQEWGTLCTPTRTGYTFQGWYTAKTGGTQVTASTVVRGNLTVYAHWKANKFTVAYNANGGSGTTASHECEYDGTCVLAPNGFTKTGYSFKEWNTKADGSGTSYAVGASIKNAATSGTKTYYAIWTEGSATLTYNANGHGTAPSSVIMKYTEATNAAAAISATGYTFGGWNTKADKSGTTYAAGAQVKAANVVPTAMTLFAMWTERTATLTYNANGHGTAPSNVTMKYSTSTNAAAAITATGYNFTGWNTASGGTGTVYAAGAQVKAANVVPSAITLYAQWTEKTATLTYNANGHGTAPSAVTMKYTTATNAASAITASGYVFNKWNTKSDGSGTSYAAGAQVKAANVEPTAKTLYAIWYTNPVVTFNCNGGTGSMNNQTVVYNTNTALTANACTKTGYNFAGWNTVSGGTGTAYANQANIKITANTTLYAQWTEKTYSLTIKPNGGSWGGTTNNTAKTLKYTEVLDIANPTRTGYTFGGWSELSVAKFTNGLSSMSVYNNKGNGVVTVTSQSKSSGNPLSGMSNEMKVANSGTAEAYPGLGGFYHGVTSAASKKFVHLFVAKLPVGYYFWQANNALGDGYTITWLTNNAGTGNWQTYAYLVECGSTGTFSTFGHVFVTKSATKSFDALTGSYTAYVAYSNVYDITSNSAAIGQYDGSGVLTASWTEKTATLTYNANGHGTAPSAVTMKYTTATNAASAISATGYTFGGWNTNSSGSGTSYAAGAQVKAANVVPSATTLYAKWSEKTATLSYNANGHGTAPAAVTMKYTTATNAASAISATGYTFGGWNTNSSGTGTSYAAGAQVKAANVEPSATTLYAKWTEQTATLTYNANGHGTAPSNVTMKYSAATNAASALSATGWTFKGWNTKADGSGTSYAAGAQVKAANVVPSAITLYAQWQANTVTITYNCNGGGGTTPSQATVNNGQGADLSSRSCNYKVTAGPGGHVYYMLGWNTSSTATTALSSYTASGNAILYAVWAELFTYNSTYYVYNDGSGHYRAEFKSGGTLTMKAATTVDIHAVGGGGGGSGTGLVNYGGSGGGGGKTTTVKNKSLSATTYAITIGTGGSGGGQTDPGVAGGNGTTSSFGSLCSAAGGTGGGAPGRWFTGAGGSGGSGGSSGNTGQVACNNPGGTNGGNGTKGTNGTGVTVGPKDAGTGQGTTTRDFGETAGTLRAGGGAGGCGYGYKTSSYASTGASGGTGGGGTGGQWGSTGGNGDANYGGGAGGGGSSSNEGKKHGSGGTGGTGIVIMRDKR